MEGPTQTEQGAWTSTNPKIDALFVKTITTHGGGPGSAFVDIGVTATGYSLLRTDGGIESWNNLANPTYVSTATTTFTSIKYVPTGPWNLIGASDSTRQIRENAQTGLGTTLGSYPSGVNHISEIAGVHAGPAKLNLYIMRADPNGGGFPVLQTGQFQAVTGLTWGATTYYVNPYLTGLAAAGSIYTIIDYFTSGFAWWTPSGMTLAFEHLSPYTEHAYLNPGGFYDRFAPMAFDYNPSDDYFYGIDDSIDPTGAHTQVIARLKKTSIVP